MTAPPSPSSPSSILPPTSSHCALISSKKNSTRFKNFIISVALCFFKSFKSEITLLKLCKSWKVSTNNTSEEQRLQLQHGGSRGLLNSTLVDDSYICSPFLVLCPVILRVYTVFKGKGKGKAITLQAWTGPQGPRRVRLPDFKTIGT